MVLFFVLLFVLNGSITIYWCANVILRKLFKRFSRTVWETFVNKGESEVISKIEVDGEKFSENFVLDFLCKIWKVSHQFNINGLEPWTMKSEDRKSNLFLLIKNFLKRKFSHRSGLDHGLKSRKFKNGTFLHTILIQMRIPKTIKLSQTPIEPQEKETNLLTLKSAHILQLL